ncbi:MAG: SGNH/GDSL hydrolase family protein, partial [Leptolyngbyaceae bacterium]|nr:SGNH/GDSL hydrolase family protein [Leptolyngbyaceae bacterium]
MKKRIFATTLVLWSLSLGLLVGWKQKPRPIQALYVFGDSLSDVGNGFRATGGTAPSSPPYFQGRYSNGRVWVEHLASKLTLPPQPSTNFAYGGAMTEGTGGVPSLRVQVQSFTEAHASADPNALYVLLIGANDYLKGATNPTAPVENISRAIATLDQLGARKFLVSNLPDLGQLPATRQSANASRLSALTRQHNRILARSLEGLRPQLHPQTQIIRLDTYTLYQEALTRPAKFGLSNVTQACLGSQGVCNNPQQFLFWD